jgi:site-specific recombinase XerD
LWFLNCMDTQEAIIKYTAHKSVRYERASQNYPRVIRKFFEYVKKEIGEADNDDVVTFQLMLKKTSAERTQSLYAIILRDFFTFTNGRGWTSISVKEIDIPRANDDDVPVYVVQHEFEKLCDIAKDNPMKLLCLRMLWFTGVRVSELCDIEVRELDLQEKCAYVDSRKAFKPKLISWDDDTNNLMLEVLALKPDRHYLFCSLEPRYGFKKYSTKQIQRWINELKEAAGIEKAITPHSFRHGFTKEMLNIGMDIPAIQEMLGHKNPASIFKYTKRVDADIKEKAREALRLRTGALKFSKVKELLEREGS